MTNLPRDQANIPHFWELPDKWQDLVKIPLEKLPAKWAPVWILEIDLVDRDNGLVWKLRVRELDNWHVDPAPVVGPHSDLPLSPVAHARNLAREGTCYLYDGEYPRYPPIQGRHVLREPVLVDLTRVEWD